MKKMLEFSQYVSTITNKKLLNAQIET